MPGACPTIRIRALALAPPSQEKERQHPDPHEGPAQEHGPEAVAARHLFPPLVFEARELEAVGVLEREVEALAVAKARDEAREPLDVLLAEQVTDHVGALRVCHLREGSVPRKPGLQPTEGDERAGKGGR